MPPPTCLVSTGYTTTQLAGRTGQPPNLGTCALSP